MFKLNNKTNSCGTARKSAHKYINKKTMNL